MTSFVSKTPRFDSSSEFLQRARQVIPTATQTFSKSTYFLPEGISPHFAESAKGAVLTDIDGNQYTDFINSLLCISLGYGDEEVNRAVHEQLDKGTVFSLPHRLETEVAELLVDLIPSAEMVRFGKNGSDATAAAIRLARAHTGKDRIAVCGYHGWQDWYIGSTTRNLGVPEAVTKLTHAFVYNDIESLRALLKKYQGEFAAVIMEPMNVAYPKADFLQQVKALCEQHRLLLIFDETITGFRFHLGGAQALFGVTPDITTLGKGMSNGLPLSAIVGKRDIMMLMEDIFFSGTFGGETLSLAAAKATIHKMKAKQVPDYLDVLGTQLIDGLNQVLQRLELTEHFSVQGHPSWSFIMPTPEAHEDIWATKTYLTQEFVRRGILCIGSHNISFAHTAKDITHLIDSYEAILTRWKTLQNREQLLANIDGELIKPIFKVR